MPFQRPLGASDANQAPPNFIRPLQNKRVVVGQKVVLECQLDGHPEPVIKWLKDGQNVTNCPDYQLQKDGNKFRLVMQNVQLADAGRFECQALNAAGSKASSCTLIVAPSPSPVPNGRAVPLMTPPPPPTPVGPTAPYFVKELKHQPLKIGGTTTFECRVVGNPTPEVTWLKDSKPLQSIYRYKIENDVESGICLLTVSTMFAEDVGEYSCVARNQHGEAKTVAEVLHKEQYERWIKEEQTKITSEKKRSMMQELDSAMQQPRKQKGPVYAPSQRFLEQRYSATDQGTDTQREQQWLSETQVGESREVGTVEDAQAVPVFLRPLGFVQVHEGQDAVFHCQLGGNPKPRICWLKDGEPVAPSQRILMTYRGTMAELIIKMAFPEDSGNYTLMAQNQVGTCEDTGKLLVTPFGEKQQHRFMNPQRMQRQGVKRTEETMEYGEEARAPQFIQRLIDVKVREKQMARFDVKIIGSPYPSVEWYKDKSLIQGSGKYRLLISQDGQHSLLISACDNSDAGSYTCVATNPAGTSQSSCMLHVEGSVNASPPQFTEMLQSMVIPQGTAAVLRAKVTGNPPPTMSWRKDNYPLTPGTCPYTITTSGGQSELHIPKASFEDSGWYQCDASNTAGTASSRARVSVQPKRAERARPVISPAAVRQEAAERPLMTTPELHMIRSREMATFQSESPQPVAKEAPKLMSPAESTFSFIEGQSAQVEVRYHPADDPNLRIVWQREGTPLEQSPRINQTFGNGLAYLNISPIVVQDSGKYVCLVMSRLGEAEIHLNLIVTKSTVKKTRYEDRTDRATYSEHETEAYETGMVEKPNFVSELRNVEVVEGRGAHFEARLVPTKDPKLQVEWFHNGQLLKVGSRYRILQDFGFVALNIAGVIPEDSGVYTCRATNSLGVAETSGILVCTESYTPLSSAYTPQEEEMVELEAESHTLPEFRSNIQNIEVPEGGRACFEARVVPARDPHLKIEWYKDGQPIRLANRIKPMYEFGFVSLVINPTNAEDAGQYICVATNLVGTAQSAAQLICHREDTLVTQSRHVDSLQRIRQLEQQTVHIGPVAEERPQEEMSLQQPVFVKQLSDVQVVESQNAHFESRIMPVTDPKMTVEWYHNGQPLSAGHRFRPVYDFGFAALDILYVYPEDAGVYSVVATNQLGQAVSEAALAVQSKKSIYLESQRPEGLSTIQKLESATVERKEEELDSMPTTAPMLRNQLNSQTLTEGDKLILRVNVEPINDPTMHVEWYFNGRPMPSSSRIKAAFDFGLVSLDILGVTAEDSGEYVLRIYNSIGETMSKCVINVQSLASIFTDAQHKESLARIQRLETKKVRAEEEEEEQKMTPSFVNELAPKNVSLSEGQPLHLEAKIRPTNDNQLSISWYRNDDPLPTGSRYRVFYDFGFVSLDISTMYPEDSGVYTCYVRNALGEAYSQAQVNCSAKSAILSTTYHPASVDRIVELETPKVQAEAQEQVISDAPRFVKMLPSEQQVKEGQTVHFECQLIPAEDPNLCVTWLFNNRPLEHASRIQMANDFGFISLNMLYAYPEDSGTYTCLAKNKNGQTSCSCTLRCIGRGAMQLESYHPDSLKRIEELERPVPKPEVPEELCLQKPVFTALLPEGFDNLIEGQTLHLECQVEPMNDPKLRIEWLFNDQQLPASHRFRMVHELGYVALEILYVYPEDSGKYTCRAINDNGVSDTVCYLKCIGRHRIITESHQPESWRKIKLMEEAQPAVSKEMEVQMYKPIFVQQLTGPTSLKEGQSVHMHCQVEPSNDPNLKISWLFNGIPLKEGSRFRTMCDFGCVSLEILYVYPEDTGTYTCVAHNQQGEAQSTLAIECRPLKSLYLDTQHQDSWQRIQEIEAPPEPRPPSPERQFPPPTFTEPLVSVENLNEGDNIRLECRLEPADDPSMRIVWIRNGQPIPQGSRFRPTHDFNYVALEILTLYADDSGVYSCKATSAFGNAVTSCTVKCQASKSLFLDTQHEESWQKIQEIEMKPPREEIVEEAVYDRPTFLIPLKEYPQVMEGASIHLECQAEPQKDPNMVIEWYHNGNLLASGHRFRAVYDFGYISLDILYSFPEDSGTWTCKARNKAGFAETSVQLQIAGRGSLLLDPNHPNSWQRIQEIEAPKAPAPAAAEAAFGAPTFTQQMEGVERHEGMPVHFECRLTPVNDPNLHVEWLFNDKPLRMSNRMKMTFDFGYAALDIAYANAEDSGTYKCRAINRQGKAETSATLVVAGKTDLMLDTQHPESWAKIQEIESRMPEEKMEVAEQLVPPKFIEQLASCPDIIEGQPAHFEALLEPFNDNSLQVIWLHNNQPIQASSRIAYRHDFGIVTLDILYCFPEDTGEYVCRAANKIGTAQSTATLQCAARSSIYRDTMHQESMKRIELIEAPKEAPPPVEMPTFQKPVFTQPLQNIDSLQEGQTALFECRLIPINDPKLQVQWYFNDKPLQFSNRIMATQDFGCIQLVLNGVSASDSGVYMCRAINDLGESVNTASLVVEAKDSILRQSQHPESYRQVQIIESLDKFPKQELPEAVFDKPVIVTSLQNYEDMNDGENLHLECQVTPVNDPNLRVEWLLNGKPLTKASRYHLSDDFGFHSLDIDDLKPLDSGVYTCRVTNRKGEAAASAVVKVKGYESIYSETHHPTSWQKIQDIENKPKVEVVEEVQPVQKPQIVEPLKDYNDLPEGSVVHLEALCQPEKDNTMVVQWFRNNQPIMASQLVRADYELGVATLDIVKAYASHSGLYTVRLRNSAGEAASSCTVKILGKTAIVSDTQHESSWQKIQILEAAKPEAPIEPEKVYPPPKFTAHLNDISVIEGEPSHFECQYEPANDPDLRIEWYLNGQPLLAGSKYHMSNEFGFVTMDVLYTFPQDSGVYICKVISNQGEASTSGTLNCQGKETIIRTPFNVSSVQKIAELEAPKPGAAEVPELPPVQPKFTTNIQDVPELIEGQSAHFEASVEPTDDPNLQIQWFHNGKFVSATSRMKSVHDFGMVILDISSVDANDSGEWKCVASNKAGSAQTVAHLQCKPKLGIIYDSQQPQSLERIRVLEAPKEVLEEPAAKPPEPPKFITKLPIFPPLIESDSVHLEAQLTPLNDPKMRIQWFRNGQLLPTGHRFKQIYDFGFCVLDIIYMTAEDSGEYKCVATNDAGSDTTSATLQCQPKGSLFLEPISTEKAKAVHDLEESLVKVPAEAPPEKPQIAPVFLRPLQNPPPLQEGENAHLEATISPVNDPELKIEWFLNGKALKTGSRVKTICDFGFAILEITPVYPEDCGEYLCRATNRLGEAVTSARLVCESKDKIIRRSQLPDGYAGAQQKIDILETAKPPPEMEPEPVYGKPALEAQGETSLKLIGGQVAHFEFRLEPAEDPNMKVEWLHNGKPVSHSSRLKTINDFGFVILEIAPAEPHDSGKYSCRASNAQGSCSADVELQVEGKGGVSYEWQTKKIGQQTKITELEEYLHRLPEEEFLPATEYPPPKFIEPLKDLEEQPEGNSIRFECKLEPIGDPTLRIEWLHNGRPIPYSTRIQTQHDFGTAALMIQHIIPEDSGEYTCKATNSKGEAATSCSLVCRSKREVEMPQFVSPLISTIENIKEGDTVHMECRVTPVDDPHLVIQWYFNEKPLQTAHRFKTTFDFGFVSLDILYAYPEDSGKYVCKATNEKGETQTSCNVHILGKPKLVFQRQAPMQTENELKRHFSQYTTAEIALTQDDYYKDEKHEKPRFVTKIENVAISEGDFARFECQLAPISDPNLKVEWFHNGEPIILGHRFLAIHDFGYVALVLLYALPVDTGEYAARALNKFGHDTVKAKLACAPKKRVITESQLPPGFSVAEISKLEEQLYWSQMGEAEAEEVHKAKFPPVFTIPPRRIQAVENEPARFECAVSGNPAPKVSWFINGRPAVTGSRFRLSYDGMHYFSIPRVIPQDAGEIICVAKNSEGEVQVATTLDVFQVKDFRTHKLKTGKRESEMEVMEREQRWKQEALGSLGAAFEKAPKPSFQKLLEVETTKPPAAPLETEELKQKFQRKRDDEIYEKISPPDQTKVRGLAGFTETVQLKPTRVQQRELPKEEKINVELRSTPRKERPSEGRERPEWGQKGLKKLNVEANLLPAPEKEAEVPAKDQIKLRSAKPKPADQPAEFEHFKLVSEEPIPKHELKQREAEPVVEPTVPAKQVTLKPAFSPKTAREAEQVNIEPVQLKPAQIVKTEEKEERPALKAVHRPPGQSAKQPPVFSKQPQPCAAELGRSAQLYCEFSGDKPLTIKWFKDGRPITSSFEFQVTDTDNSSKLRIAKVKREYAGNYTVRLENVAGVAEASTNITASERPEKGEVPRFLEPVESISIVQGRPAKFVTRLAGSLPMVVTWFKDNRQVIPDHRCKTIVEQNTYSLLLVEAFPQDSGTYECVARNSFGEARSRSDLHVALSKSSAAPGEAARNIVAPEITQPLMGIVVRENEPATLTAKVTGQPEPIIRWFKNKDEISNDDNFVISKQGELCTLTIRKCLMTHAADYKIEASNMGGKAASATNLIVEKRGSVSSRVSVPGPAPKFTKLIQDVHAKQGTPAKFTAQFSGTPAPQCSWLFKDQKITPSNDVKITTSDGKSQLEIRSVSSAHVGQYSCQLTSSSGSVTSSALLTLI